MRVTLMCDASYCNTYKVAGYGFWIASERGKAGGGGSMARQVGNNNIAEMMAICNTVWEGIRRGLLQHGDELLIQSDCLGAMGKLRFVQTKASKEERDVITYFERIVRQMNFTVNFRHVKGHTSLAGNRYAANRQCDKIAKQAMRKARIDQIKHELKDVLS